MNSNKLAWSKPKIILLGNSQTNGKQRQAPGTGEGHQYGASQVFHFADLSSQPSTISHWGSGQASNITNPVFFGPTSVGPS